MSKLLRKEGPAQRVLNYTLKKFDSGLSESASEFVEQRERMKNDFRMSEILKVHTGISKIEEKSIESHIEVKTLEKLKEVQESAYQEAYNLGLEEGKKLAYQKAAAEIDASLQRFEMVIKGIESLKPELLKHNETHLVNLTVHMATRLAQHEVQINNDSLVEVMRKAIEVAQLEENVEVHISPVQYEYLEKVKQETGRQYDFLKSVKLIPNETVTVGGCIIETNYGVIDARFEERVNKLWDTIKESLYRVKDKIGAA